MGFAGTSVPSRDAGVTLPPPKFAGMGLRGDAPHLCRHARRRRGGREAREAGTPAAPRRCPVRAGGWPQGAAAGRAAPCPRCPALPARRCPCPAPCPNFLNRSDTWTSITLTHGAHVSRPARPAGLPPPGADPLCTAGDSAPLPALRGPARPRDSGRTALASSPLSSEKINLCFKRRVLTSTAMVAAS